MKHLKKTLLLTMLLLMTMTPLTPQAASSKSQALKAYAKMLSRSTLPGGLKASGCSFSLVYIDNNSVPELLVKSYQLGSNNGYFTLFTYKSGKVVQLGTLLGTSFGYYKKKGVFCDLRYLTHPMGGPGNVDTYFKINNGRIASTLSKTVFKPNPFYNRTKTTYHYAYCKGSNWDNSKQISKSNYQSRLKKLIGSRTMIRDTKMNFYANTSANRKKRLK